MGEAEQEQPGGHQRHVDGGGDARGDALDAPEQRRVAEGDDEQAGGDEARPVAPPHREAAAGRHLQPEHQQPRRDEAQGREQHRRHGGDADFHGDPGEAPDQAHQGEQDDGAGHGRFRGAGDGLPAKLC